MLSASIPHRRPAASILARGNHYRVSSPPTGGVATCFRTGPGRHFAQGAPVGSTSRPMRSSGKTLIDPYNGPVRVFCCRSAERHVQCSTKFSNSLNATEKHRAALEGCAVGSSPFSKVRKTPHATSKTGLATAVMNRSIATMTPTTRPRKTCTTTGERPAEKVTATFLTSVTEPEWSQEQLVGAALNLFGSDKFLFRSACEPARTTTLYASLANGRGQPPC